MNASIFAERLKELRKQAKLSQKDLADAIGQHPVTISRYEAAKMLPHASNLQKLAEVLNTSVEFLVEGTTDEAAQEKLSDRELLRQFAIVEKMSEHDKAYIKRFLNTTIKEFVYSSAAV